MTDATLATPDRYDIFLSYPSVDRAPATELRTALEALGLRVWLDTERIEDAASIQHCINTGLARCRVLVAWYSKAYARSRACQWELTAALIVSQAETLATKRVLVVNPEADVSHIAQTLVRDIELIPAKTSDAMGTLAQRLQVAAAGANGLLGDVRQLAHPRWLGSRNPRGSNRFVGRLDELWQVHNALTAGRFAIVSGQSSPGAAVPLASVRGSGGMGKSLLAEEYALRFGAFWPGGIVWFDALGVSDRPEEAPAALAQRRESSYFEQLGLVAMALGIDSQDLMGLNLRQLRAVLGQKLQGGGQAYLWLVDDLPACSPAALDNWQAPSANGATLITSRARQHEALGAHIALGILQPDDAYALLCAGCKPHNLLEEAAARSIVQRLGGHAMAVDQARAACEKQGFVGFLTRLDLDDQHALALSKTLTGDLPNGHEQDIAKTFLGSINCLSPDGLDLLTLAAQLSNAPISRDLIVACKLACSDAAKQGAETPEVAPEHEAYMAAQDWADLAMQELTACSLVDPAVVRTPTPDAPSVSAITLHTLIARVARWQVASDAGDHPASAQWHKAAVRVLQHKLRDAGDIRQQISLVHAVQHARQLCERVATHSQAALLERIAAYDYARGHYPSASEAGERAFQHFESTLGKDQSVTMLNMSNLARTRAAMGHFAAARTSQEWLLEAGRRILGEDHPSTLNNMNNLASTLSEMGEYAAARELQMRALILSERLRGDDHPDTLALISNVAVTLQLMGEYADAKDLSESVLAARRRVLGEDHPETLASMNSLAIILSYTGDHAAARVLGEQALAAHSKVFGEEHPVTLTSMSTVANAVSAMGDFKTARAMHERVLAVRQRALGDCHPDTLTAMNQVAGALSAMGEHTAAMIMEEKILIVRSSVQGEEHPDTLTTMANLALTLSKLDDFAAARGLQERVLSIHRKVCGEEHPDTLTNMGNLASTLRSMGELPAAREMEEQVLAIQRRVLGAEHPETLTSMSNLGGTLLALGDMPAARAMAEQALAIQQQVLGAEHPATLTSMNNLAVTLRAMGEFSPAYEMQHSVLELRQRVLGRTHPDTVGALGNLLHMLHESKDETSFSAMGMRYPATLAKLISKPSGENGK